MMDSFVAIAAEDLPLSPGMLGVIPPEFGGTGLDHVGINNTFLASSGFSLYWRKLTDSMIQPEYRTGTGIQIVTSTVTGMADGDVLIGSGGNWVNSPMPVAGAHDVLSATHTDTLASAVSRGSVIVGNSTPKWAEVTVGTNQLFYADGTDAGWSSDLVLANGTAFKTGTTNFDAFTLEGYDTGGAAYKALLTVTAAANPVLEAGDLNALFTAAALSTDTGAGDTLLLRAYDVDGTSFTTFATLTANNTPTMDLSDSVTKASGYIYRAGGTDVPITDGGTGASTATAAFNALSPVTTRGDIIVRDATDNVRLALGSAGKILRSDGTDLVYSTATYPGTTTANRILYSSANDTIGQIASAANAVLVTDGSSVPSISTTLPNNLVITAGDSTHEALQLTAGAVLGTAAEGAIEFDGDAFYTTPAASSRGVSPSVMFTTVQGSAFTGADVNTAQPVFNTTEDVLTLQANTTYRFEAYYSILGTGTTSHTFGTLFAYSGTITSAHYNAFYYTGGIGAVTGSSTQTITSVLVLSGAITTTVTKRVVITGIIRTANAGTITPQYKFSAAPGAAEQTNIDSYFMIWPVGTDTVKAVGNWA